MVNIVNDIFLNFTPFQNKSPGLRLIKKVH